MTGGTVGKSILLKSINEKMYLNQRVALIGQIFKNITIDYINVNILSPITKKIINDNKNSTNDNISMELINNFLIALPPEKEQIRIISKLESILTYIEEYGEKYKILEVLNNNYKDELKRSILQYAIQGKLVYQNKDDEPASVLIDKILNEKREMMKRKEIKKENLSIIYKDSDNQFYEKFDDGKVVNITEEIPFDIPNNWNWTKLNNLTSKEIKRGKSPKYIERSTIIVFAQKCNQKNGIISLLDAKYLNEDVIKKYDKTDLLQIDDIVINSTGNGTLGRVGILTENDIDNKKIVVDSHVTLIRINTMLNKSYILYYLRNFQKYLELKATGSTNQTELSPNIIKNILIPIPPLNEQESIVNKVKSVFKYL
jgi:type I restriction enzyme S subunit